MSSIDERVVGMKFNNSQFEQGVKTTLGSLDSLKKGLNFDGATKGLENIGAATKNVSLAGISSGVDSLVQKFSALGIIGVTAIANIANKAVNAGTAMAKSLTIDPIKSGFDEYELKMGSIQTILANTSKYGTKLGDVTKALDELNEYSDKTIYNFGEMVKNVSLFTNAGIKLEDATAMIKGFSNEAASSGVSAANAAGAAYQLSQAMSAGKVTLMDWKSLTNAGMGSANMKSSIIQLASAMGTFKGSGTDAAEATKSFNTTLETGWLKADVMTNYLKIQAGELSKEQMSNLGLTGKQIEAFNKQARTANDAATKVRTFTALIGTLRESVGSSWAETFGLLVGDFDEATTLWTNVNKTLGTMLGKSGIARNKMLEDWDKLGGRKAMLDALGNAFKALMSVIKPITDAFSHIFPMTTGKQLFNITIAIRNFMKSLILSKDSAEKVKKTFLGVFAIFDIGWQVVKGIAKFFFSLFSILTGGVGSVLSVTAVLGKFLERIQEIAHPRNGKGGIGPFFDKLIEARTNILEPLVIFIGKVIEAFATLFSGDVSGFTDKLGGAFSGLKDVFEGLRTNISNMLGNISGGTSVVKTFVASLSIKALNPIITVLDTISGKFDGLRTTLTSFSPKFDTAGFKSLGGAGKSAGINLSNFSSIGETVKNASVGMIDSLSRIGASFEPIMTNIGEFFSNLTGKIKEYVKGMSFSEGVSLLNTGTFIALYLMLRSFIGSIKGLIKSWQKLVISIKGVFDQLGKSLKTFQQDIKANIILKIAIAVGILVASVWVLSKIPADDLKKAMIALSVMFVELGLILVAFSKIDSGKSSLRKTAFGLILLAIAVDILVNATKKLAALNMEELKRGLIGVGSLLVGLALFSKFAAAEKGGVKQGVGLVLLALAIKILVDSVSKLGNMDTDVLMKGIISLGIMLALLVGTVKMFNKTKGIFQAAAGMLILSAALMALTVAIKMYANLDPDVFAKGLMRMAISLVAIALALRLMPSNFKAGSLIVVAAALVVLAGVIKVLGGMDPEEVAQGLKTIALALLMITVSIKALSMIKGGAKAVWELMNVAKALVLLAGVMYVLGNMSGDQVKIALIALAGAFTILIAAGWGLKPVILTLLKFAGVVKLMGIAMMLAGAGFMLFAIGLGMLAVSGAVGFAVLTAGIMGLLPLIPLIAEQFGHGMVAIAKVLGDSAPVFIVAFTKILVAFLVSVSKVGPKILTTFTTLLISLLDNIIRLIPKFVELGWKLLLGIQKGIRDHIQEFVVNGLAIITEFIKGLIKGAPDLAKAGVDLIVSFVEGVNKNRKKLDKAGKDLIVGWLNGIRDNYPDILKASKEAIVAWLKGMKDQIPDILSASKDLIVTYLTGLKNNLGPVMTAGKDLLVAYLVGLKNNLPDILKAGGDVIVAFLNGLAVEIPRISTAALNVLINFVNTLAEPENAERLVGAGVGLLLSVLKGIINKIPDIIGVVYQFFTKLYEGLANKEKLIALGKAGTKLLTTALDSFATTENLELIRTSAIALITRIAEHFASGGTELFNALSGVLVTMLNDLAAAIRTNGDKISDAAVNVGAAVVEGVAKGLTFVPRVLGTAAQNLAKEALDHLRGKKGFDENSPSKIAMSIGKNVVLGLAISLNKNSSLASDSATGLGHSAIEAMRKSISGMSDIITGDIDMRPSITPILDLTDVKKNSGLLGNMLTTDPITVGATYSQAQEVSAGYNENPSNSVQMRNDIQSLAAMIAANPVSSDVPVLPRPMEFHIGVMEDGDSLFRRARATNKMLTLAEGGDSTQIASVL